MKTKKRYFISVLVFVLMMGNLIPEKAFAEDGTPVIVRVGSVDYEAVLYNNQTVRGLQAKMPFQLTMLELNGNEKYRYLDYSLPENEQAVDRIQAGDIMLYGSDCLVIFYKSFQTPYRYTRVGRITNPEGLERTMGSGNVTVSFSAAPGQAPGTIHLTKESLTLHRGQSKKIKLIGAEVKKIRWSSSNKSVVRVSGGKITGKKAGKAVVTARYMGRKYKCHVTVKAAKKKK